MPIRAECPQCGKEYNVAEDKVGRRFQCKRCQANVVVPAAATADPDDPLAGMGDFSDDFMQASWPKKASSGSAKGGGGQAQEAHSESRGQRCPDRYWCRSGRCGRSGGSLVLLPAGRG